MMSLSLPEPAGAGEPSSAGEALQMAVAGLGWLARADLASVPVPVQAEALRVLERAGSMHVAARARVLAAFSAQRGFEDDGQGSARMWLTWQTRVTAGAARGTVGWMRRLQDHPAVADGAGRRGVVGVVGAADHRLDRRAAGGGAGRMRTRSCWPRRPAGRIWPGWRGWRRRSGAGSPGRIEDGDDGFLPPRPAARHHVRRRRAGDRGLVGPVRRRRCRSVLDSLGKKMGAEDTRTSAANASTTRWRRRAGGCSARGACPSGPGSRSGCSCTCRWTSCSAGSAAPAPPYLPPGFGGLAGPEDLPRPGGR